MLILIRSINREVTVTMLAACVVLLLVSIASQFRVYIEAVARGALEVSSIAPIMLSLLPQFLSVILPISFYIGVVVGLERWHKNNELVCLHTAGVGQLRFTLILVPLTVVTTVLCALMQFWLVPAGVERAARISAANERLDAFDVITPRRFTPLAKNMQIYADAIEAGNTMQQIFVYSFNPGQVLALLSKSANLSRQNANRYLRLNDGFAYNFDTGDNELTKFQFVSADIDITPEIPRIRINNLDALSTRELLASNTQKLRSLLWWRISLVLIVPVLFFGVVITQRVTPRKGVGLRLLGVFTLCLGYFSLLYAARSLANLGSAPAWLVYLAAHSLVLVLLIGWYRYLRD